VVVCAITCDFKKDENKTAAIVHPNGKTFAGSEENMKMSSSSYNNLETMRITAVPPTQQIAMYQVILRIGSVLAKVFSREWNDQGEGNVSGRV
jgi:hypothetical protein